MGHSCYLHRGCLLLLLDSLHIHFKSYLHLPLLREHAILCLASAYFINKYWNTRRGKSSHHNFLRKRCSYVYRIFYPVISGAPVSTSWIHQVKMVPKLVLRTMTTQNNPDKSVEISVVFPAYNEVDYLEPAVEKTAQTLNEFTNTYEIIIAEDGSTDGTAERAEELAQKYPYRQAYSWRTASRKRNRPQQRLQAKPWRSLRLHGFRFSHGP